ncbi:Ig-like domain-containing protein [Luteolibacter sp. Populi]|uniref:Ig-like domain-containing protein n=1 Tax=Luteolibacter sp. Populi TaxID=3230487 RepID=UPI0034658E0F
MKTPSPAACGLIAAVLCCAATTLHAAPIVGATLDDNTPTATQRARGGTIDYTAIISNTGDAGATGVSFTNATPANTTDVAGSLRVSPVAADDAYITAGNTRRVVNAANGLLANDYDPDDPGAVKGVALVVKTGSVSRVSGTATGGTLTVAADGSFTYTPGLGQVGTERWQYTITDAQAQDSATVGYADFSMSRCVWYVRNLASSGNGRSHAPFNTLAAASAAANAATDIIYVFSDSGANAKLDGNIVLDAGQQLLGQAVALVVDGTTLFAASTAPTLLNTAAAPNGNVVTLASNNTVRGLILGNHPNGSGIIGANVGTLTINSTTINGTGKIVDLTGTAGNSAAVTLDNATTTSSGSEGIRLVGINGSVAVTAGAISGAAGADVLISGGNASFTFPGAITNTLGRSIDIQNKTGGTVAFSGAINDTGSGLYMKSNAATTTHFTGSITASTGANPAFTAMSSSSISVTGSANTLTTTTETALYVESISIAPAGLTFRSISANGGQGIYMSNTGTNAGLTVTGTGTPGSGGTIQNTIGDGILLNLTKGISLDRMNIQNGGGPGIRGSIVTNFTLKNSNVTGNGFSGIDLSSLWGTVEISGCTISGSAQENLIISNTDGTIDSLNVKNTTFDHPTIGTSGNRNGLVIGLQGTAVLTTASVSGCTFRNHISVGMRVSTVGSSRIGLDNATSALTVGLVVSGCTFDDNSVGLQCQMANTSDMTLDIQGNTVINDSRRSTSGINTTGNAIHVSSSTTQAGSTLNARIDNNIIGSSSLAGSGSTDASGIFLGVAGLTDATVLIQNNTIRETPVSYGMRLDFLGPADDLGTVPVSDVTVINNDVNHVNLTFDPPLSNSPKPAIYLNGGNQGSTTVAAGAPTVRASVSGNTVPAGVAFGVTGGYLELNESVAPPLGILQLVDASPVSATATAELQSHNTGSSAATAGVTLIAGPITTPPDLTPLPLLFAPGGVDQAAVQETAPAESTPELFRESNTTSTTPARPDILTSAQLDATVAAALARWEKSRLSEAQMAALLGVQFEVADLPGQYLGEAAGLRLRVDCDAGGNGWFIDATPLEDTEFAASDSTRRYSLPTGEPAGRIDLLTTILHEQGHALGLEDRYAAADRDSVMFGYLTTGERRLPAAGQATGTSPHHCGASHFLSGPVAIGTLPPGKSVRVTYSVTIANTLVPANTVTIVNSGTVTAAGGISTVTDDPGIGGSQSTVTKVAVAPILSSVPKGFFEDTTVTFTAGDFSSHFIDPNGDTLASVKIISLPANGTLKVGAGNASAGQVIPAASLDTISFVPAADFVGTTGFSWNASDGTLFSENAAAVDIGIGAVNDRPSVIASDVTVGEDSGPQSFPGWASFNPGGGPDEAGQTPTYTWGNYGRPDQFSVLPAVAPDGTLTFTLTPDATAGSTFQVWVDDGAGIDSQSVVAIFTIAVNKVNDKPTFTVRSLDPIFEGAGAQTAPVLIDSVHFGGDVYEWGEQAVLACPVSNVSNPAFFTAGPAVDANGWLTYTPTTDASGSVTFDVRVQDNGGTVNGGVDTSDPKTVTITINGINDKPGFTASNPPAVNEDAGAQSIAAWASFNSGGGSFEASQTATYAVSNVSNTALFASAPTVAADGTLTYTPVADANGSSTFEVRVQDSGGTLYGGIDLSDPQTFTITINAVNDKPTFTATSPTAVNEDFGARAVAGWASGFNRGATNESAQTLLAYTVSNVSNTALFSAGPAVSVNGTLTYTPAANANGSSTFQVRVKDSGGTANGGIDLSDAQTFTIMVNPVNDLPGITGQAAIALAFNTQRTIGFSDLTVTDSDNPYPTGFTLTVSGGANYTLAGNTITPAPGFTGTLSVPVKVNDGTSNSNTFNLVVTVNPDPEIPRKSGVITPEPGGGWRVSFIGDPSVTYTIQYSAELIEWQFLGTATADASGHYSIVDHPPASAPSRFYRSTP